MTSLKQDLKQDLYREFWADPKQRRETLFVISMFSLALLFVPLDTITLVAIAIPLVISVSTVYYVYHRIKEWIR